MASSSTTPRDKVVLAEPGSGYDLFIFSMYEKPGWQARVPGDRIHVPHPGSAIQYQGQLYELMEIAPGAGAAHTWRYALRRWDDACVVRRLFHYTAETERAMAHKLEEHRRRYRRHTWLIYLFPLTCWLPSPWLQRWEREWGLPMRTLCFVSTFLYFVPSGLFALYFMYFSGPQSRLIPAGICFYVGLEQAIRYLWMVFGTEAQGSLLLTALWHPFHPRGEMRRRSDFSSFPDEVRQLKDQPWDVEIVSVFRDPMLVGDEPVMVEGVAYQPLGYIQQGQGLYRRYVFRLKQVAAGTRAQRTYARERAPGTRASLMQYERRRDHVHNWAPLYGFLPARQQLELEHRYDLLSAQATAYSALLMLGAAGLKLLFLAVSRFDAGYLAALYFAGESAYRLGVARSRGEPVGSLLGWLLLPFLPR
jgi:hypothetical protein